MALLGSEQLHPWVRKYPGHGCRWESLQYLEEGVLEVVLLASSATLGCEVVCPPAAERGKISHQKQVVSPHGQELGTWPQLGLPLRGASLHSEGFVLFCFPSGMGSCYVAHVDLELSNPSASQVLGL